jgi:hypothetical protein
LQFLSGNARRLFLLVAASMVAVATASQAYAHPAETNEHGVNESVFPWLWAGDEETTNVTALNTSDEQDLLAAGTDIPLDAPPKAVERWNRNEHQQLGESSKHVSVRPTGVHHRTDDYLERTNVAIFAVQPSTRAHLSPSETPLYVPPNGHVLGYVDYRVTVPSDKTVNDKRIRWSLKTHDVQRVTLSVDGTQVDSTSGTRTPNLSYGSLRSFPGETHRLTLEATVSVSLNKTIREEVDCDGCPPYRRYWRTPEETVSVQTSITVHEYDLSVSGYRARYPNGDLGLVVYKNEPWYGYSLPTGEVRGVWRYYVARDQQWDNLTKYSGGGSTRVHSPAHPLQVHAYPIETGPTPAPRHRVDLLDVYGQQRQPASLPSNIHLDTIEQPYTSSYGLAARIHEPNETAANLTATGLVRTARFNATGSTFAEVPLRESNLTLTLANETDETLTVRVSVRDNRTGTPIVTERREGYVVVNGRRRNTTANGTVEVTVPRTTGTVAARYEPGAWWRNIPGYVADSDVLHVQSHALQLVRILFELAVPVGLLLFAGFLVDRITSWGFWPPWRDL